MKYLVVIIMAVFSLSVNAQSVQRQGNTFVQQKTSEKSEPTKTQYTYKDSKGKVYPIFLSKNGRAYVNKISSKTGKTYKYYLPKEISKTICKEMGIKYVEPNKTK